MFERRGESRKIYTSNWLLQISGLDYFHNNHISLTTYALINAGLKDIERALSQGNNELETIRQDTGATMLICTSLAMASYHCAFLTLRGLPEQIEQAHGLIGDIITQGYENVDGLITTRVVDAVIHKHVNAPIHQIERALVHGNNELRNIRQDTGATILIRTSLAIASYDCAYLTLRGLPGQIEQAHGLIEAIIFQGYENGDGLTTTRVLDAVIQTHVNAPIHQIERLFVHGNHELRAIRENAGATILIRTTLAVASYDCGYLVLRGLPGQTETARTLFEDIIIQGYGYRNVPIRLRALDAAHVGHNIVNVPIRQTMRLFGKNVLRIKDVEIRTGA